MLRPYATSVWDMSGRGCPPTPDGAGEGLSLCQAEEEVTHQAGALQQERLSRKERGDMEATWCLLIEREPLDIILKKMGIFGVCPSQR